MFSHVRFNVFVLFGPQILNGKYVEGFYIYAIQMPDTALNASAGSANDGNSKSKKFTTAARRAGFFDAATSSTPTLISRKSNIGLGKREGGAANNGGATPTAMNFRSRSTYHMLTILNGGGVSSCTLGGLQQYTPYEFFIVPFYKSVEGKPSNLRMARTLEDGKY